MGIADIDFKAAPSITKALQDRLQHENWGYLDLPASFTENIVSWNKRHYGVTFEPSKPPLKAGDKEVKVKVRASDEAAVGKHTITVTGKPTKGTEAANKFDISIDKK